MSLSEESNLYYSERRRKFDQLKRNTPIGIFGSFYESRKADLLVLQKSLHEDGYYPQISEDLEIKKGSDRKKRDTILDRKLSERLIEVSDIYIFVLVRGKEDEPDNLIQSVSMEIERLNTLNDCGQKSAKYVAVYAETGLIGKMGGVCEGLLALKKGDWVVEEFNDIHEILKTARQFCLNCILDMYSY